MNKKTNEMLKYITLTAGDKLGGSACTSCTNSYCCEFQVEVGIAVTEFDEIEHLVTPQQIARAKVQLENEDPIIVSGAKTYRCPFLSEAGRCEIYDQRFMICAMYSTVGHSDQCSLSNKDGRVNVVNPVEVIMLAINTQPEVKARMLKHGLAEDAVPSDVLDEFKKRYL